MIQLAPITAAAAARECKQHFTSERMRAQPFGAAGQYGHSQVNGRNALSWEEKFELDVWYVEHRSLWVDVKVLFKTVATVLRREGISQEGKATAEPFRGAGCLRDEEDLHGAAA